MADKETSDYTASEISVGPMLFGVYIKSLNTVIGGKTCTEFQYLWGKNTEKEKFLLQGDVDLLIKWSWSEKLSFSTSN